MPQGWRVTELKKRAAQVSPGRLEVREERTRWCVTLASTEGETAKRAQPLCGLPATAFNCAADRPAAKTSRLDRSRLLNAVGTGTLRYLPAEYLADHR